MSWQERLPSIYGLADRSGAIRYIGKANDPDERYRRHINEAKHHDRPVHRWIREHGAPVLIILERDCGDWERSERAWIAKAKEAGANLLNVAEGGAMPWCSRKQRAANGRKSAQTRNSEAWRFNRDFAHAHRRGELSLRIYAKLRELAAIDPTNYGMWANI
jgi:hypothetical protein